MHPHWGTYGRALIACLLVTGATATCGGVVSAENVGDDGGSLGNPSTYVPPPYDAAAVERALALCAGPPGSPDPIPDDDGFRARAVGAWFYCGSMKRTDTTPTSGTGLELASDGYWYNLVNDGDGGVVRDLKHWGSYRLCKQCPDAIILEPAEIGALLQPVYFRSGPREMSALSESIPTYEWMVAFGQ
jgi:hypothetical protein